MKIEEYLRSDNSAYFVPDSSIENAKAVIFECYPTRADLEAKAPVSALKTWNGIDLFDENDRIPSDITATVYISNVPLYSTSKETENLTAEFEGIRLAPRAESEVLREYFAVKMRRIIENENIKLVAYKLEMFKRYYDDFVKTADEQTANRLKKRLESGTLMIVEFPRYTIKQIRAFEECYSVFKSSIDKIVNYS